MSIELSNVKEEKSLSFSVDVAMPSLSQKSTAIKIEPKKDVEKKKEEPKFFYELLEEAVRKGIKPAIHQTYSNHMYDCPVALVCTLLGEIPDENDGPCGCTINHTRMINILRKKNVKFMDTMMDYCPCCDDGDDDDYLGIPCGHDNQRSFTEPMLALHISKWHAKGNLETVELLKETLYGKERKKVLPKEEKRQILNRSDIWEIRPVFEQHVEYPSFKDIPLEPLSNERMIIRNPFGELVEIDVKTGEIVRKL